MKWINNPCGYCRLHRCLMSVKMVKKKDCIGKHCKHLSKKKHSFWKQKNANKMAKKNKIMISFTYR